MTNIELLSEHIHMYKNADKITDSLFTKIGIEKIDDRYCNFKLLVRDILAGLDVTLSDKELS